MNIIVCNDTRKPTAKRILQQLSNRPVLQRGEAERLREALNIDASLCRRLRDNGHQVALFDGYEDDLVTFARDPQRAGARLLQLIVDISATGLIMDLQYGRDFRYGIELFRYLRQNSAIPADMTVRFYSRFVHDSALGLFQTLTDEFGIPRPHILDRNTQNIAYVVEQFR